MILDDIFCDGPDISTFSHPLPKTPSPPISTHSTPDTFLPHLPSTQLGSFILCYERIIPQKGGVPIRVMSGMIVSASHSASGRLRLRRGRPSSTARGGTPSRPRTERSLPPSAGLRRATSARDAPRSRQGLVVVSMPHTLQQSTVLHHSTTLKCP